MGQEVPCTAHFKDQISEGKARLELDKLIFRGSFRLSIPLKEMSAVEAKAGHLRMAFADGVLILDLGSLAEKWAQKILHPKSLMDKLGVKADSKVVTLGIKDESFFKQLEERTPYVTKGKLRKDSDFIFFSAEQKEDLGKLESLEEYIKRNGAVWVVIPKGKKHIREVDIIEAGKEAGLVDNKVVSFSETHTTLKLVIPLAKR